MIDFKNVSLLNSVPPNLLKDEKVHRLSKIITRQNQKFAGYGEKLNYVENLRLLPENVIDHLLWEKGIGYKEGLMLATNIDEKIALLESAIYLHRIKGTPAAIEHIFSILNIQSKLQEWFEYGGDPYHFKLEVTVTERGLNEEMVQLLEKLVMRFKNTRSYLEAINISLASKSKVYVGAAFLSGEEITIYPYTVSNIEVSGKHYLATGQTGVDTTVIYPKGGANE